MTTDRKLSVGFSKTMDFNFLLVVSKLKTENMLVDDLLISFKSYACRDAVQSWMLDLADKLVKSRTARNTCSFSGKSRSSNT